MAYSGDAYVRFPISGSDLPANRPPPVYLRAVRRAERPTLVLQLHAERAVLLEGDLDVAFAVVGRTHAVVARHPQLPSTLQSRLPQAVSPKTRKWALLGHPHLLQRSSS